MNPILLEDLCPLEVRLSLKLKRLQNLILLILNFFNRGIVDVTHDGHGFVDLAVGDEVSWSLWEAEEDNGDDDGRDDLDGDGESPADGATDKVHAKGEEVGD